MHVLKGHGTGNDFVLVPDPDARHDLTPSQVRALTDRRFGIGGDGVLRVVPTAAVAEVADQAADAAWFMDYRNHDGSLAEMCGNGARVFARYLVDARLERGPQFSIATRGGARAVRIEDDGDVTVDMGVATTPALRAMPVVQVGHVSWNGSGVLVPNPHCVVLMDDADELAALDLTVAPHVAPASVFPDGVNVEFAHRLGAHAEHHVRMRVHERGVGETLSCGTGAVAVMVAVAAHDSAPLETAYTVEVPGGTVVVTRRADSHLELRGPAVIVGSITLGPGTTAQH
ncbi:MAG: diaminopimelate epimerase [Frankiales bacterium]|nr:diaminopimelate epimerase [Frankiales bacterium]